MPRVSICIPTYQRPDLLKVALDSCLMQTFPDFEIVIGDDSPDTRSEEVVRQLSTSRSIRYVRNVPQCGQARNVNQLFCLAQGEFLVLLHDDDVLVPTALQDLIGPLQDNPAAVASFGRQYVFTHDGTFLDDESEARNKKYCRTDEAADQLQRSVWSALVQQLPCDGYMVRTAAARTTLYRDDPEVGQACDADFGYRLSQAGDFYFIGKYTSGYRTTLDSISSSGLRVHVSKLYFILRKLSLPPDLEHVRHARLQEVAPVAVNGCLLTSARLKALHILFGRHYPWKQQFGKGIAQLALTFVPKAVSGMLIERRAPTKNEASPTSISNNGQYAFTHTQIYSLKTPNHSQ